MDEKFIQIAEHTHHLFHKYGVRSLTMSDIARENMISKKTLYNYVSDKADLIDKVFQRHFENNRDRMKQYVDQAANAIEEIFLLQTRLTKIIEEHNPSVEFDLIKYYPKVYNRLLIRNSKKLYEEIKRNITRGQDEGLYRSDVDADLIAKSRVLFQTQRVDNEVVSFKDFTNSYALKQMMMYHMRAICTMQGLRIVDEMIDEFKKHFPNE